MAVLAANWHPISEHPSWSLGTRFWGHLGACMGSQSVFIDVFSKILGATRCETLQKLYLHVARGPLCRSHSSLADSQPCQCCRGKHCHQRALSGPRQTVNWHKLGEITVLTPDNLHQLYGWRCSIYTADGIGRRDNEPVCFSHLSLWALKLFFLGRSIVDQYSPTSPIKNIQLEEYKNMLHIHKYKTRNWTQSVLRRPWFNRNQWVTRWAILPRQGETSSKQDWFMLGALAC